MKSRVDSSKVIKNILYPLVIESLIVFIILSSFLLIDFNTRGLLDQKVINTVLTQTTKLTVAYIIIFRIAKSGIFLLVRLFSSVGSSIQSNNLSMVTLLSDIFITLFIIITTNAVRPILQKVFIEGENVSFDQVMVKFDATHTVLLLSIIALPLIILITKKYSGKLRLIYISAIVISIGYSGYLNNNPNYDARVYESRADWIKRDWEQQETDAQKALEDAETGQEKAIAYYWLGVAANRQGRRDEAIVHQLQAIEADPNYGAPHSSLCMSYAIGAQFERSKYHCEQCVELSPRYAWCYYSWFIYYYENNQLEEAYKNLRKAIEIDPHAIDFQNTLESFKTHHPEIAD